MSLSSAMQTASSALMAQSQALSMISDNISNSETTGYKTTTAAFSAMLSEQSSTAQYNSGAVTVTGFRNISQQGTIESTSVTTNLAVDGKGLFVVSDSATGGGDLLFTRDGSFGPDENGYLVSSGGYYLMGYAIDANGEVSSTLSVIDIDKISGTSTPTSEVTMSANLPAEADVGTVQTTTIEVYDSLGVAHNVEMSFTKTAANTWDVSFANPTSTDDATTATGTAATTTFTLTFNDDGTLASATPALELDITGWTSGAADSVITFDIGETGEASGLTQYASTDGSGTLELGSQAQNGARFGNLSGVEVTEGGTVVAKFDNGQTREIYRIPLAVFSNADGLDPAGENVFSASAASGDYILRMPGTGGAGDIQGAALETSTTDINSEFTKLIECQAAYSAASKLITVSNDMMDTLINVIR